MKSTMDDVLFLSISEVAALYRSKEISPVEVVKLVLRRMEEWEPRLNAFISVLGEQVLDAAQKAERAFLQHDNVPILTGIPYSAKDLFYTEHVKTTCGSRIYGDFIPTYTATAVEKLEASGAILFGKTNMLEFAYGAVHPDYGQCNNPWDTTRTAGGSSSGSAAAVAAGIGYGSIGTDTGGSIRIPASYCGVVGLKPTYGLVSAFGVFPLSWSLDHAGPITRSVQDAAVFLDAMAGYDPRDQFSDPKLSKPASYAAGLDRELAGTRIGILPKALLDHGTEEVKSVFNQALQCLSEAGCEIVEVDMPGLSSAEENLMKIMLPEASYVHRKWLDREKDYAVATYLQLQQGISQTAFDYLDGLEAMHAFKREVHHVFDRVDAIVTPTVAFPAPEEDPAMGDDSHNEVFFTAPFNLSGHPAISINGGFTEEGLPIGLQFVGKYFGEADILSIAHAYERKNPLTRRPVLS
ncbi:amidase [Paenibacillus sp. GP183]|jgi:aspartyl-tRNA(Asn)/glutamyl-tRNA(Gln) amidotransferase subunit A|uniref:amidase n=1 Tax=Paenibacillus sp. GP183 TaxID=1882751 RepID=UPI00089C0430|nr:amidase [Paenibacillus sp. GP183]SEB73573.1 aspartyl-tRNA(Asn)/glutamyl-tRNA(Gln) amidotransferase subunit A [Paenibacillus sp. GP183]